MTDEYGFVELSDPDVRQGDYISTTLEVWRCEEECDCSQVQVVRWYWNALTADRSRWPVLVWRGTFFTDGEGWNQVREEIELAR